MSTKKYFGAIEGGGTKFVCAIGNSPEDIKEIIKFPTTTPEETLKQAVNFFKKYYEENILEAIGIGCFGPLDLKTNSSTYGYITSTPKEGWKDTDLLGFIKRNFLNIPVEIDTDVNTAALGEYKWGSAQGLNTAVYFTIGTGIGGGAIINGNTVKGILHPEMGHMFVPRLKNDSFESTCPFHKDCFEGLASGTALRKRSGLENPETLSEDNEIWDVISTYIAYALCNVICVMSPEKIILGGGVMGQKHLFPRIRKKTKEFLNNYVKVPEIIKNIEEYIVPPKLGDNTGILGALYLAQHDILEN